MFFKNKSGAEDEIIAISKSQAIIHFELDGTIIDANQNFLDVMGYTLNEIKGKNHRIFVDSAFAQSIEYVNLWVKLNHGEFFAGEYKRIGKNGKEVWIQASYNPILDKNGNPYKVVKFATDITKQKLINSDLEGKISALNKSQAVIEFNTDGTIITANDNFLSTMGYTLAEIKGKHHSMFAETEYASSSEYRNFWDKLRGGEFNLGEYKRIGKGGKEVWILASYNPILNMNGKVFKVVKLATDITKQKLVTADYKGQLDAISKAQAIIEFDMSGNIITANKNFLDAMGYSLPEVQGKNHSMFVDDTYAQSQEYKQFWEKLRHGEFDTKAYKRIGKGGKEVWIQASYNPIFDMNGKPFKVVKFASVITKIIETASLAEQATANIQGVAAAVEEMSSSIIEINRNMSLSKDATKNIMERTVTSSTATEQLVNSMKSMEAIVELINNIAGQVNLLALNATIEAARAGEAGKGFAVVAAEVKNLATQTAKATEDIAKEINSVQTISASVANSVEEITNAANLVDQYVTGVASALEEQSAVTKEISSNTQQTSTTISEIAGRIKNISSSA